jgi:hypothetical protein
MSTVWAVLVLVPTSDRRMAKLLIRSTVPAWVLSTIW